MKNIVHLDFETRSVVDIKKQGLDVYAKHPTTDILCVGYSLDDQPTKIWKRFEEVQPAFIDAVKQGALLVAHNAQFELAIWNHVGVPRYGWPKLLPENTACTMAMAYAMALPASLEKAAAAMGMAEQKDLGGYRIMLQLCRPKKIDEDGRVEWWEEKEKLEKLYQYCVQDVEVEKELYKRLLKLSEKEKKVWCLDQEINQRGIALDQESVLKALEIVEAEKRRLDSKLNELSGGIVSNCTKAKKLTDWIKEQGVEIEGVSKSAIHEAFKEGGLPKIAHEALLLRQEAAKSSTAKLQVMKDAVSPDGRIRNLYQYHGASTGRWSGRKLQTQNFPRPDLSQEKIEEVFQILKSQRLSEALEIITRLYGAPLQIISDCLRGFLVAKEGHDLIAADLSNIEGRMLAWLSGEDWKVTAFREFDEARGPDLYRVMASLIYNVPLEEVTKDQRLIGKVAELACGYQGGKGAFQSMAKIYNVEVPDALAESIKTRWRERNRNIVKYWWDLEKAAINAVLSPRTEFKVGIGKRSVSYKTRGSFLWCQLPSKRLLCYPYPKIEPVEMKWGDMKECLTYMGVDSLTKKWTRQKSYGGVLAENNTQAASRDILVDDLFRLEERGYKVVMHVHDEAVCEVPKEFGSLEEVEQLMAVTPEWAEGLPIAAQGWRGGRYQKG
jgi:DNA polymerase